MASVTELLPALPWLAPFAGLFRLASNLPNLSNVAPAPGPLVSVIIPARNEAATIETVVHSVLATTYADVELLVVDDRSTDDTAAIIGRLAQEDGRVRAIGGEPLPLDGTASRGPVSRDTARRGVSCFCSPTRIRGIRRSCWPAPWARSKRGRRTWSPWRRGSGANRSGSDW